MQACSFDSPKVTRSHSASALGKSPPCSLWFSPRLRAAPLIRSADFFQCLVCQVHILSFLISSKTQDLTSLLFYYTFFLEIGTNLKKKIQGIFQNQEIMPCDQAAVILTQNMVLILRQLKCRDKQPVKSYQLHERNTGLSERIKFPIPKLR